MMNQFFRKIRENIAASVKGFVKDDGFLKASSLTFYTLLSIVPILAVAFGIAKGFGFENFLRSVIESKVEQGEIANRLIFFAYNALEQSHGGVIAAVGLLALFWTSLSLLSKIELALNEIWEIKSQRSFGRQITDYLAIIIFCPIFFVISSSLSIYVITLVNQISQENEIIKAISPYLLYFLKILPFVLNWILFSFIYIVLPNTTIKWGTAIFGGVIAGTIYQIVNWIYIQFQIGAADYSAIYGSFAALPLFLIWVNISWQIVLFGAELAYHFDSSSFNVEGPRHLLSKKTLGLIVATYCCEAFLKGAQPANVQKISHDLGANQRVINSIALDLFEVGILATDQNGAFLPAKNPEEITIKMIFDSLEEKSIKYPVLLTPHVEEYEQVLTHFDRAIVGLPENYSLKDLSSKLL